MKRPDIEAIDKRASAATAGPGEILHSKHIGESGMKEEILSSMAESIDRSIAYDGGHPWIWIETKDGRKIGDFGCGPNSLNNALFWGACRTDIPAMSAYIKELEAEIKKLTDERDLLVNALWDIKLTLIGLAEKMVGIKTETTPQERDEKAYALQKEMSAANESLRKKGIIE